MLLQLLRRAFAAAPPAAQANVERALERGRAAEKNPELLDEAIEALRPVVVQQPELLPARLALAQALERRKLLSEAIMHYRVLLSREPDQALLHNNLANCLARLGRAGEALPHYRRTAELQPAFLAAQTSVLGCLNYVAGIGPEQVFAEHRAWGRRLAAEQPACYEPHANDRDPQRRLRVGYVSPDFKRHPVTYLFAPTLAHHEHSEYEIFCYSNLADADQVTARLRQMADVWRDVAGCSDEEFCRQVRADRIDILIDLAGHTSYGRLPAFARKPAPVQVSWLGYFNTTGLERIDYFVTDPHSSPDGQEACYVERLLRLPDTRFCYEPPANAPAVVEPPALRAGYITFGCFNNLSKVNDRVVALWARALRAVPGSRLRLISIGLHDGANAEHVRARFAAHGITGERLHLHGFLDHPRLLAAYGDIDIALDPFPFCGGLTSLEALWMGVPVITLQPPMIAGRQTLCFLRNLRLDQFVASGEDEYVDIARRAAGDVAALGALRADLRARMAASALIDAAKFTRNLEQAYRRVWQEWCGAFALDGDAASPRATADH